MEEKFGFEFNFVELTIILKGLKELPYKESAGIVKRIITEHEAQAIEKEKQKRASENNK